MNNTGAAPQVPKELLRAQWLANLTDTSIRIPGLGIKLGLDFIVGLIPFVGDGIMTLVGLSIVGLGRNMGAPKQLQRKMLRNCLFDFVIGIIPFAGDIADLVFKANLKNVRLLERWWLENNYQSVNQHAHTRLSQWEQQQEIS